MLVVVHQSGNDILFGLARLLEREVEDCGILARYGGEEFVVILPNYSKEQSLILAEELRTKIESTPFEIHTISVIDCFEMINVHHQ